jgi:DNA-directed RNA polymerase subunit beta
MSNERKNFGKLREVIPPPNMIENQIVSFQEFLQMDVPAAQRNNLGLESVFKEVFPVESNNGNFRLEYLDYSLTPPRMGELECIREGTTYAVSLLLKLRLVEKGAFKDEEILMGDLPMVTDRGSFIINGAERVVVSQLHRSPGIAFEETPHTSGKLLHAFRIIPDRGTWIEVQFDQNDLLWVYLDRRRRRRKFLLTTLLRAFGYNQDRDILSLFYAQRELTVKQALELSPEEQARLVFADDQVNVTLGKPIAKQYDKLDTATLRALLASSGPKARLSVYDTEPDGGAIILALRKDTEGNGIKNEEDAVKEIFRKLRPGEPVNTKSAKAHMHRLFQDPLRYDLGRVGRYKLNQKLGHRPEAAKAFRNKQEEAEAELRSRTIDKDDIVAATKQLFLLRRGKMHIDDIDHLGSRRVRNVGELLANQCRAGLKNVVKTVKARINEYDQSVDSLTPQKLVNPKPFGNAIREFFQRSQLSQLMDQINPLAELTHKRRLSALGPGGLNRDRAGFEVRDVHPSHYGRICPIETPEGPNIGLINSLSTYARINPYGFIEAPYRKVVRGKVTDRVEYMTADQEERFKVAQANSVVEKDGRLRGPVTCRVIDDIQELDPEDVDYMDVSPQQVVSVAAGLIPFLEHDDANRALMGSNMQRQGVPLVLTEAPFVGTGLERRVAIDSKTVVVAEGSGIVAAVDARRIIVTKDGEVAPAQVENRKLRSNPEKGLWVHDLRKFLKTNSSTCFNQRPIVARGQKVKAGDVIADGAATDKGELALGRNVLVAFMPWNGYNFEDAILLSERLLKQDTFTSIHIEEFEVTARDTKLGPEQITRDIPNLSETALRNLNRDGVIRIGAEVQPGDILVGKITPKSEGDLAPEEKLLRAIFGEKARDVKDTSLVVPSGTSGIVMDVKVSSRTDEDDGKLDAAEQRRALKKVNEEHRTLESKLREEMTDTLSNFLLGEKIPLDVRNSDTGEEIIPANRKITKTLLRRLASVSRTIEMNDSPVKQKIRSILDNYHRRFDELETERARKTEAIEQGVDEGGAIKNVKVYVATKRKVQVGDKMAGRHGNKGVVARIVPVEDMPYLPDGTPVDICLNPLGVPSRMNVGQVLETHLGWACSKLGLKVATPIFDGIPEAQIREYLKEAGLPETGKALLFNGHTGEPFDQDVVVGHIYMMKLNHLVADKIHARATGPYSLITQQPLGGKAQYGGQRFGEMEVWALEAYGAAYTLQELLTVKSDDVAGRTKIYEQLVKGENTLVSGTPQSFNVLMKEMQALCLDVQLNSQGRPERA